jgi:tetratricopeptide (TPR) repeat protein
MSKNPGPLILVGLFLITVAAYWNSFSVPFVFDDLQTIQRNATVHFGEFNGLSAILFGTREILFKTFALNSLWSGQEVWSYHVINFVLHLLNGFLLFAIGSRIFGYTETNPTRRDIYAALAASFFLVHPVQTESVTYISSRSELLSTLFYLAGLFVFICWPVRRIGFLCSLVVGILYFLGLGSKETVITLPAIIFVFDYLFLSKAQLRPIVSRWRFYLVYVVGASAAIYFLLAVILKGTVGGGVAQNLSPWPYLLTETRVLVHYVRLIFLPTGLNLDYDFRHSGSIFEPAVLSSIVFLCALLFLAWWLRRRQPVLAFSIFWFFITLSPTSSVVPIADVIFEHRLYLPLAGVCLSFPLVVGVAYKQLRRRSEENNSAFALAACSSVIVVALIVGTMMRNYVWGDEVRLFTDVLSKSPFKERPYNDLAFAYYKRGEYERAVAAMEQAMEKLPNHASNSWDMLANMYLKQGLYDKAIALLQKEIDISTGDRLALAYENLGVAYSYIWNDLESHRNQFNSADFDLRKEQVLAPAAVAFSKALEIEPDMWASLDAYVNVMCSRGKGSEVEAQAIEQLKTATGLKQFAALYTIGEVALNNEDYAKADVYFDQAEKSKDNVKILFYNHGYALNALKKPDRAIEKYLQAIRIEPIFIEAHHNLGLIYMDRKEYGKAIESFTEVLRLDPKLVSAHLSLASIYIAEGKRDLARQQVSIVLQLSPGNKQAMMLMKQFGL